MLHEEERLAHWFEERDTDATEGTCPLCHAAVLIVLVGDEPVPVELGEVLPSHRCPECADIEGRGHSRRSHCYRCQNTGWLGNATPPYAVAVAEDGSAREWERGTPLRRGEGLYLPHVCE